MEQGKPPSFNTLRKLSDTTDIDVNWLLTGRPHDSARAPPASDTGFEPVSDRRLAEVLAVLADEWEEAVDERAREALLIRFWHAYPDLREREQSLARVVAWLGWRVIEGSAATSKKT